MWIFSEIRNLWKLELIIKEDFYIIVKKLKMKPKIRTTVGKFFAEENYEFPGIYVIACYPYLKCLYIGISKNINKRLREHLKDSEEPLANFIRNNFADACGWRLDLFEVKDKENRMLFERKLIQQFRPMFNSQGLGEECLINN
jgi:predicted GIY-YIG superfamily endonuclease